MTRRAARFTQCELERALRAVDAHRARSGEAWRVRIAVDGAIVLEPMPNSQPEAYWLQGDGTPALGKLGEAMF